MMMDDFMWLVNEGIGYENEEDYFDGNLPSDVGEAIVESRYAVCDASSTLWEDA